MLIDLTLDIDRTTRDDLMTGKPYAALGHLGTHIDMLGHRFPTCDLRRRGILFDADDIDMAMIERDMFIIVRTGHSARFAYGSEEYRTMAPQLPEALAERIADAGVAMIGIDCGGLRRGAEHAPIDRYCAERGVFVVENLCNLSQLPAKEPFTVYTFPLAMSGWSGLPCRVAADI